MKNRIAIALIWLAPVFVWAALEAGQLWLAVAIFVCQILVRLDHMPEDN